jgi:hypothetical protein
MKSSLSEAIIKQGYPLSIVILSQVTLFGVISYRLVNAPETTEEEKIFSYAELALSCIASLIVLLFFMMSFLFIFVLNPLSALKSPVFYKILLSFLLALSVSPLGLTATRVILKDKLTEQQKDIISGLTLPSIVIFASIGLNYALGQVWWKVGK